MFIKYNILGTSLPTTRSFLSNIQSTYSSDYEFCGQHQALDEDYKGNTSDLKIDRGHVVPNAIENGLNFWKKRRKSWKPFIDYPKKYLSWVNSGGITHVYAREHMIKHFASLQVWFQVAINRYFFKPKFLNHKLL